MKLADFRDWGTFRTLCDVRLEPGMCVSMVGAHPAMRGEGARTD
jgi:hypothetical protein